MPKITVKAKIDGGVHLKHGPIIKGQEYTIEEEDFGAELFERPPGFESPHERADRERREALVSEPSEPSEPSDQPGQSEPTTNHEEVY